MAKQPDPGSFMDMFGGFGRDLKLPNVDVEAILNHHRKNLEALEKSARASAAGASSLFSRQREMLQDTLHEIADMAQSYRAPG
ncbi:phasin family protein, partial [Mesorhizobium sp. M6A.T.Ca.TU.002.02.2.1]